MFKRIDHVEIIPGNFDNSLTFYCEVLGFTLKQRFRVNHAPMEEIAYLRLGDTTLELLRVPSAACATSEPWSVGYRMLALEVTSMDEAVEHLALQGVPVTWGPLDLGDSIRAEIKDPDGLSVELRQWK